MLNGKRHGVGRFRGKDNKIYEGQWEHDKPSGYVRMISFDSHQIAYWKDGNVQGICHHYTKDGSRDYKISGFYEKGLKIKDLDKEMDKYLIMN